MKLTERIAKSASTPKTGLFATLRGLLHAKGSSAPWRTLLAATPVITLCTLLGLLALSAAAHAEVPRLIAYGSFSPGPFSQGVAVDQSSGDVYVAALAVADINKFDASGKLLSPPSPFGEGNLSGAAVNPVNGDVYVFATVSHEAEVRPGEFETVYEGVIGSYDPGTGALLSSFGVPPSKNLPGLPFTVVQIAADSAGNVYVPVVPQNEVLEYSSTGTLLNTFTGGSGPGALKGPSGVAVASSGNLWVADTGDNRIEELSPTDVPLGEIKSEGVQDAIALDGHGDVLAIVKNGADFCGSLRAPCSHLVEYSAAGVQLADVGAGSFETGSGPIALPPMVAVDEGSGRVYVSDAKGEKVWIFGPPTPPRVEKELSSEVGVSEAKLGALVNPGGLETTYRFEYDTREYEEGEGPHGQSAPFPEGSVGEGLSSHAVWATASGLAPGTTYHYRVVATSELGPAFGPDQTFTTETAERAACSNEALRGGFSATLPDCRAYELVTATTKTSVQFKGAEAAADGDAILFGTTEPLPGAPTGGEHYAATRGAGGWSAEDLIPLESYSSICGGETGQLKAYSDEPSKALILDGHDTRASESGPESQGLGTQECNTEGLQVVPGEPVGYRNLLLRDNRTGAYGLVNAPPPGVTPADANFKGASADLSHVVFSELAPLTPEAPAPAVGGPENLYEWDEGILRLLTVLPDGSPAQGSLVEATGGPAISADGSHILFTSGEGLYVRVNGERTVQVDKTQGQGASGGGSFQAMSTDGSKVFFLDESELTADSTAASGKPDLYECVLPPGASSCELSDLTVAKAGEHADVLRVSPLGSEDSSHVYFVAKGVLAEGAENGQDNLYLWDGGTTTFIATLTEGDFGVGAVSPDGAWFAFASRKSLTGYDNTPSEGGPVDEVFLYDVASQQLVCASCDPSGEAPIVGAGASLASLRQRPLADGGRLFFETLEALVPSDTNHQVDVYEYEGGQPSLISSGTSPIGSKFQGASESGGDVFFLSRQQLVGQDTEEEARVIYDARVGGGIAVSSSPPPCTNADACRTPVSPQPSIFGAPSSATFSGAGNLAPPSQAAPAVKPKSKALKCKRGFVMRKVKGKSRCVGKPTRKARKATHAKKRGK